MQESMPPDAAARLPDASPLSRSAWTHPAARPFAVLGTLGIVGGGVLSSALAPAPSYHGSWAVAYIVLVAGVAQVVLGVAQASVTAGTVSARVAAVQAACWNVGAAATVAGTLLGTRPVLYGGAALQVIALVLFLRATRRGRRGAALTTLRVVTVILLVATPVGMLLQAVTH